MPLAGRNVCRRGQLNLEPVCAFLLVAMQENGHWTREQWDRACRGDPVVWDRLFRRYQLPLFVWVRELVQNDEDALDVVQETFERALRHVDRLRDPACVGPWLFGIARQRCADLLRRRGRHPDAVPSADSNPEEDPAAAVDPEPAPDEWLIRREDEERFLQALAGLPEAHRAVVVLHCLEEFSLEDIARILGIPVGTVKSRLHHARRRLRAECGETSLETYSDHENRS